MLIYQGTNQCLNKMLKVNAEIYFCQHDVEIYVYDLSTSFAGQLLSRMRLTLSKLTIKCTNIMLFAGETRDSIQ